jgi:hypothetical protein
MARDHVDDRCRHEERRDAPRPAVAVFLVGGSIIGSPPMPDPTITPMRSARSSSSASPVGSPRHATAWIDAAMP